MTIAMREMSDLDEKALELGGSLPTGICVFPRNFELAHSIGELEYNDSAQTLEKKLRRTGVPACKPHNYSKQYLQQRDNLPAICLFVGWAVATQEPVSVQLALSVLGNYLTDMFKGFRRIEDQRCNVKIVREIVKGKAKSFEEITYTGSVTGLTELAKVLTTND